MATTEYVLHSAKVGRDFLVKVTAPFAPTPTGQKRPVIYALDGGYETVGPVAWLLGGSGGMSPSFVVSIGYLPADYGWRDQDLTFQPYADQGRQTLAAAPAFRPFLQSELRPFIRAHYPVDDDDALLLGHSAAGMLAANILASNPGEYAAYVIASPSVWSDSTIVERVRAGARRAAHPTRVYVSVGGAEVQRMLEGERVLVAALAASPAKVALISRVYEGETHLSYYPTLVAAALPVMVKAPSGEAMPTPSAR